MPDIASPENIEYRNVPGWIDYLGMLGLALVVVGVAVVLWNTAVWLLALGVPPLRRPWTALFPVGGTVLFLAAYLWSYYADDAGGAYTTTKMGLLTLALVIMLVASYGLDYLAFVGKMEITVLFSVAMGMTLTVAIYDLILE